MVPRRFMMKSTGMALIALGMITLAGGAARGGQVTGIVSFGDSLSDLGNFYAATGGASPPSALHYDQGRFSNGPIWLEYLAHDLGIAAPTASVNGGTDYAYGGAMTGTGTTSSTFLGATATVPNIGTQIATYLGSHTPNPNQLFTIWGVPTISSTAVRPTLSFPLRTSRPRSPLLRWPAHKHFIVPNLAALGSLPITLTYPPQIQQELNALTMAFNQILQREATQLEQSLGIQIQVLNVYGITQSVINDPSLYGFTNVTTDAVQDNGGTNAQGYLFWDIVHPTTYADSLIAAAAVPEPSSVVLLCLALGGLAVWARICPCVRACCGRIEPS